MASSVTHISAYSATSSGLYQSTVDGSHIYRETFEDRIKQWRIWLFGTDYDGRFIIMGRSVIDWRKYLSLLAWHHDLDSYAAFFVQSSRCVVCVLCIDPSQVCFHVTLLNTLKAHQSLPTCCVLDGSTSLPVYFRIQITAVSDRCSARQ